MQHVLSGDLKKDGSRSGYHAEFSAGGSARIKPGSSIKCNDNDTYEAQVQIWNPEKIDPVTGQKGLWVEKVTRGGNPQFSTFFPPSWSEARIKFEISEAFKSRHMVGASKWEGTSPSGIVINGYINSNRTTFYPIGQP